MRFNKQELLALASSPSNKFLKEGILHITERQEGFFRRAEVNFAHWCKLYGNLLFYLKDTDQFSVPLGVIVLEDCRPVIKTEKREIDGYPFYLEFGDGSFQRISANTITERTEWFQVIKMASFSRLTKQIKYLQEKISSQYGMICETVMDLGSIQIQDVKEIDITELPICESLISCDNLICDSNGRAPNPTIIVQAKNENGHWITCGKTEIIERCSNPHFICTVTFYPSFGLSLSSPIRFNVCDVREKISRAAITIGYVEIALGVVKDTTRLRIPLQSPHKNAGFITIMSWTTETEAKTNRSPAKSVEQQNIGHRRSQSLPPKLGVKLYVPYQGKISSYFAHPLIHTYRLQSGLGGDISVQEVMFESRLNYLIPQQLLSIWIAREKELLQEISGMGELGGQWRSKQMDLLDKHLKLLKDYSHAKQYLQKYRNKNSFFKKSSMKGDENLEFVPVNLHLQRMSAYNDTLKRFGFIDIITVGAFTRHTGKSKTGGLIKLLQQNKDSPSKLDQNGCKVQHANDVVQAIKELRKEIVSIMSQILELAKIKNPKGMLAVCNDMVTKTKTLLNLWEPALVEETFEFIQQHRIVEDTDNSQMPMSPFKKITKQLGILDLKSPILEDFTTPIQPPPDMWQTGNANQSNLGLNVDPQMMLLVTNSPSPVDISKISDIQSSVKNFNNLEDPRSAVTTQEIQIQQIDSCSNTINNLSNVQALNSLEQPSCMTNLSAKSQNLSQCETSPKSLPSEISKNHTTKEDSSLVFDETHFDINGDISSSRTFKTVPYDIHSTDGLTSIEYDSYNSFNQQQSNESEHGGSYVSSNCTIVLNPNGAFLDVNVMSSNPSANYYRPTEEPEPLDLTQLNIEASVMCLVSKVKFLCGRCGSPAVRLRQPRKPVRRPSLKKEDSASNFATQHISETSLLAEEKERNDIVKKDSSKQEDQNAKRKELSLRTTVDTSTRKSRNGNKFTDGLDLSLTTDWVSELRPSMRKLRQAMDGLLKTARLVHSVQRLQQDMKKTSGNLSTMYRRDVCFSQALTSLISGLMARIWGTNLTENYAKVISNLGVLAYFEGLLSLYGNEVDMWGDMCVAVEDLSAVTFTLARTCIQRDSKNMPTPRVIGSRHSLIVILPAPQQICNYFPSSKENITFKVVPVFFNIGINEKATLAETLGYSRDQHRSNWDNFDRLKQYHIRFKKLGVSLIDLTSSGKIEQESPSEKVAELLIQMENSLRANPAKNIRILHAAEDICRLMDGLRFTSCKSAKDRTGMAVTLEQCRILQQEFHLPANRIQIALNTMRSEGTRLDNVVKNIGERKYAFILPQVLSLPSLYRPPAGSYGKAQT